MYMLSNMKMESPMFDFIHSIKGGGKEEAKTKAAKPSDLERAMSYKEGEHKRERDRKVAKETNNNRGNHGSNNAIVEFESYFGSYDSYEKDNLPDISALSEIRLGKSDVFIIFYSYFCFFILLI